MIDLVLQGTQAAIASLLVSRGLASDNGDGTYTNAPGFDWCWWAVTGKLMTAKPVVDAQGNVTTPAAFLAGSVMLARIYAPADVIASPVDGEQWSRSKVAQFIKNNGTLGSIGGIPCYTLSSVRMVRAADLFAWLQSQGLPGHEWAGGNAL